MRWTTKTLICFSSPPQISILALHLILKIIFHPLSSYKTTLKNRSTVKNDEKWDAELRHFSVSDWAMLFLCPVLTRRGLCTLFWMTVLMLLVCGNLYCFLFLCRPNTVFIKHGSTKLGLHASDCTLVWLFNNINNQCFVCLSLVVYPRNTWRRTRKVLRVYKHLAFVCDCECYLHHVISPCTWCKDTKVLFKQRLLNTCALFSG